VTVQPSSSSWLALSMTSCPWWLSNFYFQLFPFLFKFALVFAEYISQSIVISLNEYRLDRVANVVNRNINVWIFHFSLIYFLKRRTRSSAVDVLERPTYAGHCRVLQTFIETVSSNNDTISHHLDSEMQG
jgi:hypothetical protein